jgi:hypothetical protein
MRACWILSGAALAAAVPAQAVPFDEGRGIRNCAGLRGTPAGARAVHRAPDAASPSIGRIAARTPFAIAATYDGWLQVGRGGGWISGRGVSIRLRGSRAYAFPRRSSQIVLRSRDRRPLAAHGALVDIIACDRGWVFARWEIRERARVRYIGEIEVLTDPILVEAWMPAR